MSWTAILLILYGIPVIHTVMMLQYIAEIRPRLPDRIPIHFNFSGKPDWWWKKGPFTLYFAPGVNIFVFACMAFSFVYFPMREEEFFPELALSGGIITACCSFMMYRVNRGMFDIACGSSENIMKYIGLPLVLTIVASLTPLAIPFVVPHTPEIVDYTFCAEVENGNPADRREDFTTEDGRAYFWLKARWMNRGTLRYEWYSPDGNLYFNFERTYTARRMKRIRRSYSYIEIKGENAERLAGEWKVTVTFEGRQLIEESFELRPDNRGP